VLELAAICCARFKKPCLHGIDARWSCAGVVQPISHSASGVFDASRSSAASRRISTGMRQVAALSTNFRSLFSRSRRLSLRGWLNTGSATIAGASKSAWIMECAIGVGFAASYGSGRSGK
jgi:hypothetical protein